MWQLAGWLFRFETRPLGFPLDRSEIIAARCARNFLPQIVRPADSKLE